MKILKGKVLVLKVSSKAVKQPSPKIESGKNRFSFLKRLSTEATGDKMSITSSYDHETLQNI